MIASIMRFFYTNETVEIDENLIRHMILNSVKYINREFRKEYGRLVISCDSKNYWRKEVFPYYKINRKKKREDSEINWQDVYEYMEKIKKEIKETFPYIVIEVERAESDDVIGNLAKTFWREEPILIVSRDHDFGQLQRYKNVKQYNTFDRKYIEISDPEKFLFEHIIKGDSGDSIPNVFSPANSIALGNRQKPAYQKKIDLWWEEKKVPDEFNERFELNRRIIDLTMTPKNIQDKIMNEFYTQISKPKKKLMTYFVEHGLVELMSEMNDF
jgi:5'-3' exonuclease